MDFTWQAIKENQPNVDGDVELGGREVGNPILPNKLNRFIVAYSQYHFSVDYNEALYIPSLTV